MWYNKSYNEPLFQITVGKGDKKRIWKSWPSGRLAMVALDIIAFLTFIECMVRWLH